MATDDEPEQILPMPTSVFYPTDDANRQYEALHAETGRALSSWMAVEVQAQQSFAIALEARNGVASRAVFHAAVNANARLAMANEAITHCLNDIGATELNEEWKRLYERAKKLAKRRNAVAHSQALVIAGNPDKNGVSYAVGARLSDPLLPQGYPHNPSKQLAEGISVKQLREMQDRFHSLSYDIYTQGQKITEALKLFRESHGQ